MTWVILPGMDGTGELAASFLRMLPKEDVVALVRFPRQKILSKRELVRLVDESLPITSDYILLAESFSGPIAIEIAARNPSPKRLRALILCASFARSPVNGLKCLLAPIALRMPLFNFAIRYFLVGPDASHDQVSAAREAIESVSRSVLISRFRILRETNCSAFLGAIKTPTLVLCAQQDELVPSERTLEMQDAIPGVKLTWIAGPHLLLLTRPKEVLEAIGTFLRTN
jgi:pimeloyl-ACP methyl ester carboxylesterase